MALVNLRCILLKTSCAYVIPVFPCVFMFSEMAFKISQLRKEDRPPTAMNGKVRELSSLTPPKESRAIETWGKSGCF